MHRRTCQRCRELPPGHDPCGLERCGCHDCGDPSQTTWRFDEDGNLQGATR